MFSFINNFLAQVEQQAIEMGASTDSDGRRKEQQQKKQEKKWLEQVETDEVKIGGRPLLTEAEVQVMAELYIDKLKIANQDRPKVVAKLDKYIEKFNVKKFMKDNPDLTHPDFYMVIFNETDKLVQ